MIYGYGRHSTDKQGLTKEVQVSKIEDYAKRCLAEHQFGGVFYDSATSGSKRLFERPEGLKLWAVVQPGDHVIWVKLDRAFRSVIDGANTLTMLQVKGVFVHSLDLGLDTSTPVGRCICTVMLAFAELERSYASQRTKDALQVKRRAGKPYGIHVPIGYRKVGKGRNAFFVVDEEERAQVQKIVELKDSGLGLERIVKAMWGTVRPCGREWHKGTISQALAAHRQGYPPRFPRMTA